MNATLHQLAVNQVRKETNDAVVVDFNIPQNCVQDFAFQPGQYLTVQANIDGTDVRRAYSICSTPHSGRLQIGIKHITDGVFSTYANQRLRAGDTLQVLPPQGHFVLPENLPAGGNYLMVCAGSGITPILSLCDHILTTDKTAQVTLLYGNSYSHSIMFKEALAGLKNRFLTQFNLINVLSREEQKIALRSGRIDAKKVADVVTAISRHSLFCQPNKDAQSIDHAYVCGPLELVETVRDVCIQQGMRADTIHFELFGTGPAKVKRKPVAHTKNHRVSIIKSGATTTFDMDSNEGDLLTMGRNQGTDLPFACKAGVCSTCKCQVLQGKVTMDLNYALTEDEVAQNYVLSCQAYPVSERVVVDFDV